MVRKLKFSDEFNFSIVSKRFCQITRSHKKFVNAMRISKHIIRIDGDYFEFLQDELKSG